MSADHRLDSDSARPIASNGGSNEAFPEDVAPSLLDLNPSDSNFSIWPEDMLDRSSRAESMEEQTDLVESANAEGGNEILDGLTRFTLGDYHSGRLSRHRRSETSSPSAISNTDEDEDDDDNKDDDHLGKKTRSVPDLSARRSTTLKTESMRKTKRAIPASHSDEDVEDDLNDVATFKEDWHASGRTESRQSDNVAFLPNQHEHYMTQSMRNEERDPVASRVPNEIIMHVSWHVEICVLYMH
jgi:hypothetical protein